VEDLNYTSQIKHQDSEKQIPTRSKQKNPSGHEWVFENFWGG